MMGAVSIRGYGVVSTFGVGVAPLVAGLRRADAVPTPLASEVAAVQGLKVSSLPAAAFPSIDEAGTAPVLAAIDEALQRARGRAVLNDCALVFGGTNTFAQAERNYMLMRRAQPGARARVYDAGVLAARIARALGLRGRVLTFSTACSSSANALLAARDLILRGQAARALVVGVESLSAITLGGFQSLMMLDREGCRPFDAERNGLHLGEGAAALLLEADGAGPRLLGGANLCDIHHVTSASPDGSGMARCMHAALTDAGLTAAAINAIKAHGTASRENDLAEAAAMRSVFGRLPPFTALKRYLGHTLGACGAIETVAMLASLEAGFVPAAAGFAEADPGLGCTPLTAALPAEPGNYLLNFFGFGGNYASLVIRHA